MGRFQELANERDDETAIDMSPLIDCVFILLIFFIVTTTFVEEQGLAVEKPEPSPPQEQQEEEKTVIVFSLTDEGQVMYEGQTLPIGSIQSVVKRVLREEDAPVVIQPSEHAQAGLLVRVLDEARLAGAEKISVSSIKTSG